MKLRPALSGILSIALIAGAFGSTAATGKPAHAVDRRPGPSKLPAGFRPGAVRAQTEKGRFFVSMKAPALAQKLSGRSLSSEQQKAGVRATEASQEGAVRAVKDAGGRVFYRYSRLVNAFSAVMTGATAAKVAGRPDVAAVTPVSQVRPALESSVPFIGATKVWSKYKVKGAGVRVAVIDTGVDYTHADFGGPGTVSAYEENDPNFIEPGTFPTKKVVDGFDFVGEDFDVYDDDPSNDVARPDPDPLDTEDHGTHVAGICCGKGVRGKVGAGVAPKAKILAYKVFSPGAGSPADTIVAAIERAVDPNQDGSVKDHVDVINMSLGADFGDESGPDAIASERASDLGVTVVAAAGNAGNQPAGGAAYVHGSPAAGPSVISVAASLDEFKAQTLSVNSPAGVTLPDSGIVVRQDWSGPLSTAVTTDVIDARGFSPPLDAGGNPTPSDRMLCDSTPAGNPFAGAYVLVFKGSTGAGDCDGSAKVFRAQEAGAAGVILWSGFFGLPFGLGAGEFGDEITIPAVMVSNGDGQALADASSPTAPAAYNTGGANVTIDPQVSVIPGISDWMADFSSEGPARVTNLLKPDVSAPGVDIESAGVGSGDGPTTISGTSMASPHIAGVAALLEQIHPHMSPAKIKGLIMNQATRALADATGLGPVGATVIGAGRVRADQSAAATSVAWPGSVSFGLQKIAHPQETIRSFRLKNIDNRKHRYTLKPTTRYFDYDPSLAEVRISTDGKNFDTNLRFRLGAKKSRKIWVRLFANPNPISPPEQQYGYYFFLGNIDGLVKITQKGGGTDSFAVPWHLVPMSSSDTAVDQDSLDLTGGTDELSVSHSGAAVDWVDAYELGAEETGGSQTEEDITAVGARSFTGPSIDGVGVGVPSEPDGLLGLTWTEFLTAVDEPTEPVEFGIATSQVHNTTQSVEFDVFVDAGADGVFADPDLGADYIVVKLTDATTCVFDLSLGDPFEQCSATYFPDYNNYNSNVSGLVVDAADIGLTNGKPKIAYQVSACSIALETPICDTAGDFDPDTGTYVPTFNAVDPALDVSPQVCGGFWSDECFSMEVAAGSAGPGDDPSLLLLFPNNTTEAAAKVVTTDTGD